MWPVLLVSRVGVCVCGGRGGCVMQVLLGPVCEPRLAAAAWHWARRLWQPLLDDRYESTILVSGYQLSCV